jgi:hypothetical protein
VKKEAMGAGQFAATAKLLDFSLAGTASAAAA